MTLVWMAGYKPSVLKAAEDRWDFQFPPDLKSLLLDKKPVGTGVWDWSVATDEMMEAQRHWIAHGFAFDAVYSGFWLEEFGPRQDFSDRPANWNDTKTVGPYLETLVRDIVRPTLDKAPALIPIFGHRFMPSRPNTRGLPVISVMQTDIIAYGRDLRDYFQNEFGQDIGENYSAPSEMVPGGLGWVQPVFWDRLIS